MSQHYSTEPPPTASATLETTVGPLHISLFAKQTPLACRNFLQHCLDGYYTNTVFHRVVPGFIIQGGDPTGTGSGGQSIYEDPEFEYDPDSRDPNEKIVLRDELHSRLRFNRRGLLGLAKSEDGTYGSQFFITLANCERELNGQCTLFGRLEGDSIYNVIKIAEAELVEGTDRPVYPVKITACHVGELGPLEGKLKKRQRIAVPEETGEKPTVQKKKKKGKVGKTLLSFDADEGTEEIRPTKPKFNTKLISHAEELEQKPKAANQEERKEEPTRVPKKRARSPSPRGQEPEDGPRKTRPKTPDPYHQVPPKDPEVPERSPSEEEGPETTRERTRQSALERTKAEIEALKASMRRDVGPTKEEKKEEKKSLLESMIPKSSIRGRKRPGLGANPVTNPAAAAGATDSEALRLFNDFKAKLESSTLKPSTTTSKRQEKPRQQESKADKKEEEEEEEEPQPCDLHFIVNCQSCRDTFTANADNADGEDDANDTSWMTHRLTFGKDTLGKDLNWKKTHHAEEELDSLMVIDPREKEKEIREAKRREKQQQQQQQQQQQRGSAKSERDRESELRKAMRGEREWDR